MQSNKYVIAQVSSWTCVQLNKYMVEQVSGQTSMWLNKYLVEQVCGWTSIRFKKYAVEWVCSLVIIYKVFLMNISVINTPSLGASESEWSQKLLTLNI
jgi:hypothetical protein